MTKEQPFEQAYLRLQQILEKMNGSNVSLDDSLKLYEEADQLITSCTKRLSEAETKIEMLIKNRGELSVNEEGRPLTQEFGPSATSSKGP